jgi:predicted N-acyltransferase
LNKKTFFKIYSSPEQLPADWDTVAQPNIFLSCAYLAILERSAPQNMECHFIGLFCNNKLCGVALSQYINLSRINTFAEEKKKFSLKDYIFKKFSSHILIIGNNTLTGQNAYVLNSDIVEHEAIHLLKHALYSLKGMYRKKGICMNLLAIKDFNEAEYPDFPMAGFKNYFKFCTQPNMIFSIRPEWNGLQDYVFDMNTKYRTQYNRARKKAEGIDKKQLTAEEIKALEDKIYSLYLTVADNAAFNTFYLPKDHFYIFKQQLKDDFLFYGYFFNGELIGFNTLIKNRADMDTYFLGYDAAVQKEKMLYLNMLYDMAGYAIKNKFSHVIYARSAMEIKSSIGAKAEEVYGIIKHTNPILNLFMAKLFTYFDPKIEWKERNPFKD